MRLPQEDHQEKPAPVSLFGVKRLTHGLLFGALGGAFIGFCNSVVVGLFYSATHFAVVGVVVVSAILGGLFGHVLSDLLSHETLRTGRTLWQSDSIEESVMPSLKDHEMLTRDAASKHK